MSLFYLKKLFSVIATLNWAHKFFFMVFLFNLLIWTDFFKPEPISISSQKHVNQDLVCSHGTWDKRKLGDKGFLDIVLRWSSPQPDGQRLSFKFKNNPPYLKTYVNLKDLIFISYTNYNVFNFSKKHILKSGALRGPPIISS